MSNNQVPGWLNLFLKKAILKKQALEKLPADELNFGVDAATTGYRAKRLYDSIGNSGGQQPGVPTDDSQVIETEPSVRNNTFEVSVNGIEFDVELIPQLVQKDISQEQATSLNPNADPEALARWMANSNNEKAYPRSEKGTVDPLSKEEEENGEIEQNPEVAVHKKKPKFKSAFLKKESNGQYPGTDRSNPYAPCNMCINFDAENNRCAAGLDVEKVQAAKSCSWLNSNFKALGEPAEQNVHHEDIEIYKSDISQNTNSNGGQQRFGQ